MRNPSKRTAVLAARARFALSDLTARCARYEIALQKIAHLPKANALVSNVEEREWNDMEDANANGMDQGLQEGFERAAGIASIALKGPTA